MQSRKERLAASRIKFRRIRLLISSGIAVFIFGTIGFAYITAGSAVAFPGPQNTGVPAGTVLTNYTGPNPIRTCGAVLDSVTVNGDLTILASNGTHSSTTPCVTIKNSRVKGIVDDKWSGYSCAGKVGCGPVVITDSEIANPTARDVATLSDSNYYVWRSYIHGARSGAQCDGNCEIYDSYLVADTESGTAHMDAFISNGNADGHITLNHNSLLCAPSGSVPNGSGCAADLGLFGDFSPITNVLVTNNLFKATNDAYFCIHSGSGENKPYPNGGNDRFINNTVESGSPNSCGGAGGTVYSWLKTAGEWCNNNFDTGKPAAPNIVDNCSGTTTTTNPVVTTTIPVTTTTKPPVTTTTVPPTTTTTVPTDPTVPIPACNYHPNKNIVTCP